MQARTMVAVRWVLPVPAPANQHEIALSLQEAAGGEFLDQELVDRRGEEVEVGQLPGHRQQGARHLVDEPNICRVAGIAGRYP